MSEPRRRLRRHLLPLEREQIKHLYLTGDFTQRELAQKFGVTQGCISKVMAAKDEAK